MSESKPDLWKLKNLDSQEESYYENVTRLCELNKIPTSTFYYQYGKNKSFVVVGIFLITPISIIK